MKNFVFIATAFVSTACTTTREVKEVDTRLTNASYSSEGTVGVNDKNEAVVQQKRSAVAELMIQEHVGENLQRELTHQVYLLDWCRRDSADPRLGGSGEPAPMPEIDSLFKRAPASMEFGKDEDGRLVVVSNQLYEDKLKSAIQFQTDLEAVSKTVKQNRASCEYKMGIARVKHGLPSQRDASERSLDDAFAVKKLTDNGR